MGGGLKNAEKMDHENVLILSALQIARESNQSTISRCLLNADHCYQGGNTRVVPYFEGLSRWQYSSCTLLRRARPYTLAQNMQRYSNRQLKRFLLPVATVVPQYQATYANTL